MKVSNGDCFVLENQLPNVVAELRESKVKNLALNISIKRNLQKVVELCADFRKEIQDSFPERLKELNAKEKLTKKEEEEKAALLEPSNKDINAFLQKTFEFDVFNCGVDINALKDVELTFDTSSMVDFLFGEHEDKK
jgi:hypothetical protein